MKFLNMFLLSLFLGILPASELYSQDNRNKQQRIDTTKLFDTPLEFPGGMNALIKYLSDNITYPPEARENNITGTVIAEFVVEVDGSLSNIRIIQGIGGGCDEEVIKAIKNMPRWKSGKINKKPVRVLYTLPLTFQQANNQ